VAMGPSKFLDLWSEFRRVDLNEFIDNHDRLYREAMATGDHSTVTAAYYSVMGGLLAKGYGSNWHFCPPQHEGESLGSAIRAGHQQLAARLPLGAGDRAVDVGSGAGGWMRYAAKQTGASWVGVSVGAGEVAEANRLHAKAGLAHQCETVCADARSMPFDDDSFDGASAIYALKYVGVAPVLQEVARVLKPGARLVSYNIVRTSAPAGSPDDLEPVRRFEYSTGMPQLPTAEEMCAAAEACGLQIVENSELMGVAPWYHGFEKNAHRLASLSGSRSARGAVRAAELVRLLPRGCGRFTDVFIDGTVTSLLEGGKSGMLNGANVLVFQKA
jgi:cyclopropane fatty-acyl-phospholipid synthase-like methyltransferase